MYVSVFVIAADPRMSGMWTRNLDLEGRRARPLTLYVRLEISGCLTFDMNEAFVKKESLILR